MVERKTMTTSMGSGLRTRPMMVVRELAVRFLGSVSVNPYLLSKSAVAAIEAATRPSGLLSPYVGSIVAVCRVCRRVCSSPFVAVPRHLRSPCHDSAETIGKDLDLGVSVRKSLVFYFWFYRFVAYKRSEDKQKWMRRN
ncbi:hypothetical protein Syun_006636 [Stephania yunnanensis]|uniref:Uncharacterized protein n=1 Tax=Stephania yunnanensis TaxID=152371 RepID=A0AAP0KXZ1_9MAGN